MSTATMTAPDGSRWQVMVTDRTKDNDDSSRVGIREVQLVPHTDEGVPQGFSWHGCTLDWPAGIRIIESWDGYDPRFD